MILLFLVFNTNITSILVLKLSYFLLLFYKFIINIFQFY